MIVTKLQASKCAFGDLWEEPDIVFMNVISFAPFAPFASLR